MITEEWAKYILKTEYEAFDQDTIAQAKNRIIDTTGCIIGGANASGNSILLELMKEWGGKKEATILVHGIRVPVHNAAWLNCIMARSFDFGIVIPYIGDKMVPAHVSESTIPTAMTAAEWRHASGKEFLTALILGEDITIRISAASKFTPGGGWDTPGIVDKFGTVAIAAKLMGLNGSQIINSFGIILDQLAGSFQSIFDAAHSFKLGQGLAARDGIISAEMAQKGWVGAKDPLEGKCGYFTLYCQSNDLKILTSDLGKEFFGGRCTYKPYPGCGWTHPVIDCALELVNKQGVNAPDIEEITIKVAPMHLSSPLNQPFIAGEFPQGSASFSYRYATANALIRKSAKPEHYTEELILDPAIALMIKKIKEVASIQNTERIDAAEVRVKLKDGTERSARVEAPKGNPLFKPMNTKEIKEKYRENVSFSKTISKSKSEQALDMIENIEKVEDMEELAALLVE
jgi:2-methylcitrate dehydratase PrpD